MSTISTSIRVQHRGTNLSFSASETRDVNEDGVKMDSITVAATDEVLSFGDITVPRQVAIRLVSGDPVKVGLSNSEPYPFYLSGTNESMLLNLNTGNVKAVSTFMPEAVTGALDGKYIELREDGDTKVWPWFSVGSKASGTITYGVPSAATGGSGTITLGTLDEGRCAKAKITCAYSAGVTYVEDGDTLEIGSVTYTWKTTLTQTTPNQLKIPASPSASEYEATLVSAINRDSYDRGTLYSYDTDEHPQIKAESGGSGSVFVYAKTRGTGGNSIGLTRTATGVPGAAAIKVGPFPGYGVEDPGATYTMTGGVNGSSVTIGSSTFTCVDQYDDNYIPLTSFEFVTPWELEEKISNQSGLTATRAGLVITVSSDAGLGSLAFTKTGAGITLDPATGNLSGGSSGSSVTVSDQTFTYVTSGATGNQFSSSTQLTNLINSIADVDASLNAGVITITASVAGAAGNSITLSLGTNPGTMSVSGSGTLSGGADGAAAAPTPPGSERLIQVGVESGASAASAASALAGVLDADAAFEAVVSNGLVIVTDAAIGPRSTPTNGDTGWSVSPGFTNGGSLPEIHLKSEGVSQVFAAVTPN